MARLGLVQFSTDKAFYAALKMHVYASLDDTILRAVMGGNMAPLEGRVGLEIGRFTARKTNYLFVPDGPRPTSSAEFFGYTSHKVREKFQQLADDGVVDLVGRGLRDAQTYKWKGPVRKWELCSYKRFSSATGEDISLNLENLRVFESFADDPFTLRQFLEMYMLVHEAEYERSRWGKRKFDAIRSSFAYEDFLKRRLQLMHKQKLVEFERDGATFRLTPRGVDAAQHFILFAQGPGYVASWDMCFHCPLNRLCNEFAVTDIILEMVQKPPVNGVNGDHPAAPEGGGAVATGNGARGTPLPERPE